MTIHAAIHVVTTDYHYNFLAVSENDNPNEIVDYVRDQLKQYNEIDNLFGEVQKIKHTFITTNNDDLDNEIRDLFIQADGAK